MKSIIKYLFMLHVCGCIVNGFGVKTVASFDQCTIQRHTAI